MTSVSDVNEWAWARRMKEARRDMERLHCQLQHRNGVALSVLHDAERVLGEIWEACQDPRTPDEIIDGVRLPEGPHTLSARGWSELRENLHLLGHYLNYAVRLLEADEAGTNDEEGSRRIKNPY